MAAPNIVPLYSDSVESRNKARSWAPAAWRLGIGVRSDPDCNTVAVLPCSDSRLRDAAWLARNRRVPGSEPAAAAILASKALAYDFLRARGFDMLFSYVPLVRADLGISFDRPVIVKPEYGSGTYAPHPWGYKVFSGMADLRSHFRRRGIERRFLEYQAQPDPRVGRYLVMEYVPSQWTHAVECIVNDGEVDVFDQYSMMSRPKAMTMKTAVMGERLPGARRIVAMAREFARLGLRRSLLIIQCVERENALYPIDFNMRVAALVDRLNQKCGLGFCERALRFMLGRSASIGFRWPAPRVGIHRLYLPQRPGRWRAAFGAAAIPLVTEVAYDPRKPYDWGYAWPGLPYWATASRTRCERSMPSSPKPRSPRCIDACAGPGRSCFGPARARAAPGSHAGRVGHDLRRVVREGAVRQRAQAHPCAPRRRRSAARGRSGRVLRGMARLGHRRDLLGGKRRAARAARGSGF
jgi:hypothetical protein